MSLPLKSANAALLALREQLPTTRFADRTKLARELDRLFARKTHGPDFEPAVQSLAQSIEASKAHVERLRSTQLRLDFDAALPITAHREEIAKALAEHQLIVVCGATGSGKTTQLPKMCIAAGRGTFGLIGHTQPRRIAARALANRLAAELATNVGAAVGYQVRFNDRTGPDTRVKLMTDGILLRELEHDRLLRRYDTLIIDEAHERSLNIDFLLGVLKRILPQRPELRVIITSATIDPQRFAEFYDGAPIIEVSGRGYPVEVRYRPLLGEEAEDELTLAEGVIAAVRELDHDDRGDVLVFLPGEKHIRDVDQALEKAKLHHTEVVPLFARLSTREQERVFERHHARRVVLATNVAETSLTVPGIRHVIDSGLARISRYSVRGKVQRLPIEPIAQASANQRKGRCGRESPGICIRLFDETDFGNRPLFTPPEVLRTNLASVILQMATLGLGEAEDFPFIDPPDTRLINDGYRLLQELKAVDDSRRVTSLGKQIATVPVDPRLARMLMAADHHRCVAEMLVLAAFLASQDPRERPADAQQQADQKHATYADSRSDFVTVLKLWTMFNEQQEALSASQLRKWCRENFLSYIRLREWKELHRQLSETAEDLELKISAMPDSSPPDRSRSAAGAGAQEQPSAGAQARLPDRSPNAAGAGAQARLPDRSPNAAGAQARPPADYADLHQAILTGFLGGIGSLDERREYEGARGSRFVIAPGTPLAARPPKWIVAASLMETTRLYARMVAAIETQWIEAAGAHLVKRSYSEPHWVRERGFVAAFESTTLYGLTLASRRRVNFGTVEPEQARQIFVREALVEGHTDFRAPFIDANRALRRDIEMLEAKIRRRDVLVDDQAIVDFYVGRLPADVNSIATLQRWMKSPQSRNGAALLMSRADLMRRDAADIDLSKYPDALVVAGNALPLQYRFEPTAHDDGITITVPEPLVPELSAASLAWLVPGWRLEMLTAVLRALPKHLRKAVVPVPEFAARALQEIETDIEFPAAMARWLTRVTGTAVDAEVIVQLVIPDYLRMNVRIANLQGLQIAEGRDLVALRRTVRDRPASPVQTTASGQPRTYRSWDFDELPIEQAVERRGLRFTVYPTLRDRGDGVELAEAKSRAEADALLREGALRLATLALPEQYKYARKRFADTRELVLLGQGLSTEKPLPVGLADRVFADCFFAGEAVLPRSARDFQALLDRCRAEFGTVVDRVAVQAVDILKEARLVREKLTNLAGPAFKAIVDDVQSQVSVLLPKEFPARVPPLLWPHEVRYLKALNRRLDKAVGNAKKDLESVSKLAPFVTALRQLQSSHKGHDPRPELERLEWMIEEFRVSLFAQDLKTAVPVSDKRLADQLELARREARAA
jgi:ATP-dependent helicase HrpA